ncbi:MAG: TauD/TfdA family dioxygenase [Candidimonas sp.]
MPHQAAETAVDFLPLSPSFGAEVKGMDLSMPLSDEYAALLRQAYDRYHLLLFRGREVTSEQQARLGRLFGDITVREKNFVKPELADTQHVSNTREDGILGLGELDFHSDQLFHAQPLSALILYAVEVPSEGGDTRFSNTSYVYRNLPSELKSRITGLSCRHAYNYGEEVAKLWKVESTKEGAPEAVHPFVYTDPRTGENGLWVNGITTVEVIGMAPSEGKALVDEVRNYIRTEPSNYTHRWQANDLVLWNNLVLHHARTPFDSNARRTLRRTPIV